MTEERIYKMANRELLNRWADAKDALDKHENVTAYIQREQKAWNELMECEKIMKEKGYL